MKSISLCGLEFHDLLQHIQCITVLVLKQVILKQVSTPHKVM